MSSRVGVSELLIDLMLLIIILSISSGIFIYLHKTVISPQISKDNSELSDLDCDNLLAYMLTLRNNNNITYLIIINIGKNSVEYEVIAGDEGNYTANLSSGDYGIYLFKNVSTSNVVIICNDNEVINPINVG